MTKLQIGLSRTLFLGLVIAATTALWANTPEDHQLFERALALHSQAQDERPGAAEEAVILFRQLHQLSQDPVHLAYLGSALTQVARDAQNVLLKVAKTNDGLDCLDQAVAQAPHNVLTRRIRAEVCLALPDIFQRLGMANDDLTILLRSAAEDAARFEGIYDPAILYGLKAKALQLAAEPQWVKPYLDRGLELATDPATRQQLLQLRQQLVGDGENL